MKPKKSWNATGESNPNAKLTNAQARDLREKYNTMLPHSPKRRMYSARDLAKMFGIDDYTVWQIGTGRTYKDA